MKRWPHSVLIAAPLLALGCRHIFVFNTGIVNKNNNTVLAAPIDPTAFCAELAEKMHTESDVTRDDIMKACGETFTEQEKVKPK